MGDRYVKSAENKKIIYMDATILYGHSMIQILPYDEIEMWHGHSDLYMKNLEDFLNTPDDSHIGHFIEVDIKYPDNITEKTKMFTFCPENRIINKNECNHYMKNIQPKNYTKSKKINMWLDW